MTAFLTCAALQQELCCMCKAMLRRQNLRIPRSAKSRTAVIRAVEMLRDARMSLSVKPHCRDGPTGERQLRAVHDIQQKGADSGRSLHVHARHGKKVVADIQMMLRLHVIAAIGIDERRTLSWPLSDCLLADKVSHAGAHPTLQ